jgi:dTDP-3-amino-3,4,6-trideoxy-alpha-D-glucose transaminase
MPAFAAIARWLHAALIQDACQAHGALCGKKPFTAFSPYVAYSFYPTKNLGCLGDGGAVATGRRDVAASIRLLRDGARDERHVSAEPAMNARLDEIQASFLRVFLPRLAARNERRRQLAAIYDEELQGIPGIRPISQRDGSVYHLYVVRAKRRERLRHFLEKHGVGTAVHYPVPLHLHPAFRDCGLKRGDLPNAERACREILSLPLWPGMEGDAVREIARLVRVFASSGHESPLF